MPLSAVLTVSDNTVGGVVSVAVALATLDGGPVLPKVLIVETR